MDVYDNVWHAEKRKNVDMRNIIYDMRISSIDGDLLRDIKNNTCFHPDIFDLLGSLHIALREKIYETPLTDQSIS